MEHPQSIRLNKFLAERLGLSRREADEAISAGKVTIDGVPAALGARLPTPDKLDNFPKVCYNEKIVPYHTDFLYLAMNKPVGYVCSRRAQGPAPTLYELLPAKYQSLKTVGRLDKDSSGLILLTNDGDFAYQMTHPKFHKEKIYEVELDHPLAPLHQQMISDYGVMLDDGPSKFTIIRSEPSTPLSKGVRSLAKRGVAREPHGARPLGRERPPVDGSERRAPRKTVPEARYTVILSEGRNRQIRRTFAALGYRVVALHRTQFGPYQLSSLKSGEYTVVTKV